MKYIDADKLYEYLEQVGECYPRYADNIVDNAVSNVINGIKTFIASLQQEQPEVDLEKEFEDYLDNVEGQPRMWHPDEQIEWAKDIARHFYELGLNARKEETK